MKLYGIPNCDTVKKVRALLEEKGVDYEFVNFKKTPPTKSLIKMTKSFLGELPVNKRGTTFRKIKEEYEEASAGGKVDLLIQEPSAIKRPILLSGDKVLAVGKTGEYFEKL